MIELDARDGTSLRLGGASMIAHVSGALLWPAADLLVVADLHFEKGTFFAGDGHLLPPYDTRETLARLAALIDRYRPARVVALGDSFHDDAAPARLEPAAIAALRAMTASCAWTWIAGNHDPVPPAAFGGTTHAWLSIDGIRLRHAAEAREDRPEISGHFHPRAIALTRVRRIAGRCFVTDGRRLILPAFGAYAGGLDVFDPAIADLFGNGFEVHLIAGARVRRLAAAALSRPEEG